MIKERMNEYKHFFLYEGHDILQTTIFDRKNIVKTSSNDFFSIGITLPFRETPLKRSKSNPLESNQFLRSEELDFLV